MGKRDTDGESYNLSDLPGKIPGSVVDDEVDIHSSPGSASSSGKMPKKVQIGGAENFEEIDLVRFLFFSGNIHKTSQAKYFKILKLLGVKYFFIADFIAV